MYGADKVSMASKNNDKLKESAQILKNYVSANRATDFDKKSVAQTDLMSVVTNERL